MKILILDIETSPLECYTWGIYDQNIPLNMIKNDWSILAWSAKWLGKKSIMYQDNRNSRNVRDDKNLLKGIWELIDKADIIITQNGKKFDIKKLNTRFLLAGFPPPSSYKHIDTKQISKKMFGFTSNKLEHLSEKLNLEYKKLKHKKFPGFELWEECLKGNVEAWKEMELYNKHDVLTLEALYNKFQPWDNSVNFDLYSRDNVKRCNCGSSVFRKNGYFYGSTGRYQRYKCTECGAEIRNKKREKTDEKRIIASNSLNN